MRGWVGREEEEGGGWGGEDRGREKEEVGGAGGWTLTFYSSFSHIHRYQQYFDLEGDTGIVVRGIGTCVTLIPGIPQSNIPVLLPATVQGVGQASKMIQEELLEQATGLMSPKQRLLYRKTSSSDSDGPSSPNRGSGKWMWFSRGGVAMSCM